MIFFFKAKLMQKSKTTHPKRTKIEFETKIHKYNLHDKKLAYNEILAVIK